MVLLNGFAANVSVQFLPEIHTRFLTVHALSFIFAL